MQYNIQITEEALQDTKEAFDYYTEKGQSIYYGFVCIHKEAK
jgi:hypothetical protein